jgi:6-phosphogluconolactonase
MPGRSSISVHDGLAVFREAAVAAIAEAAQRAFAERDRFVVALAGGGTPRPIYELLAASEHAARIDWGRTRALRATG